MGEAVLADQCQGGQMSPAIHQEGGRLLRPCFHGLRHLLPLLSMSGRMVVQQKKARRKRTLTMILSLISLHRRHQHVDSVAAFMTMIVARWPLALADSGTSLQHKNWTNAP